MTLLHTGHCHVIPPRQLYNFSAVSRHSRLTGEAMKIAGELKQLVDLDERSAFTDAELAAAKAVIIARTNMDESAIEAQIAELRRQKKEIELLDRDWEKESQRYAVTGKPGAA